MFSPTFPFLIFGALFLTVSHAAVEIVPGASWTSPTTHAHMQAHGAGVIEVSGTYYLIGENKTSGSAFQSIACYSSRDLATWTFEKDVLALAGSGDLGPGRVVERPKVLFHDATGSFVLWMHIDSASYAEAKVGVATSTTGVCGDYTYRGSWRPLGFQSRDVGLFKDDDGAAYLLSEDRANGLRINRLTDDYLNVSASTHLFAEDYEAPAMIKKDGVYFIFGSHLTGWDPNDNVYNTATSLSGPWAGWKNFAPAGTNTFQSQTNYVLPVGNDLVVYLGDRWVSSNLGASTYVWLPLTISGTSATTPSTASAWVPSVAASTWAPAPANTTYAASSSGTLANNARSVACSGCSGGSAAGYIGGPDNGSVTFSNVSSSAAATSTLVVYYANGDAGQRFAQVVVNGVAQEIAFVSAGTGQTVLPAVVQAAFSAGAANTVTIQGVGGGLWGPDVDRIVVPSS